MNSEARRRPIPVDGLVGKLKEAAMNGVPHDLVHVAQVKSGGFEGGIAHYSLVTHGKAIDEHDYSQEYPGYRLLRA